MHKKVVHARLPSAGFPSWSQLLAVSLQVTWVINPAIGCHYFPPGLQLPRPFCAWVQHANHPATEPPCDAHAHTHTHLMALCPGLPRWAGTRKVKPIWILREQETVSGSGISWTICKSAPRSRQITTPAPHYSVFTGRMLFLPPNQQCQSSEGNCVVYKYFCYWCRIVVLWTRMCSVCLLQLYPPTGCKYVTTKSLIETSCWSQLHSRQ